MSSRRDDGLSIAVWEQSPWRAFIRFKDAADVSGGVNPSGRPGTGQPFREDTELAREILGRALDAAKSKKNFVSASSVAQSRVESEAHLMAEDARRWRPGGRRLWELSDEEDEDKHDDKHIDMEQGREAERGTDSGDEASDERSPSAQPKEVMKQNFTVSSRRFSDYPRPVGTPSSTGRRTAQRNPSQMQRRPNTSSSAGSREDGPLHSFPSHGWTTNAQQRPPSRLQLQVGPSDLSPTPLATGPLLASHGSSPWPGAISGPWSGDGTPAGDVLGFGRSGGLRSRQSVASYSPHPPSTPPAGGRLLQLQGAPALWRVQRVSSGPRGAHRASDSSDGGGMRDTDGGNPPTTPTGGMQGGLGSVFGGPLEGLQRQRLSLQIPGRTSRPGDERHVVGFASDSPATPLLSSGGPPYEINIVRPVSVPRLHAARMERLPSRAAPGTPASSGVVTIGRLTFSRQGSRPAAKVGCASTSPSTSPSTGPQGHLGPTGEASQPPRTPTPSGWVGRMLATPSGHYY